MNGAIIFPADLIGRMPIRIWLGLLRVSSYPDRARRPVSPNITRQRDPTLNWAGQDVLLIDDIVDSGGTLRLVQNTVAAARPATVETAVLLRKPSKAPEDLAIDYVGFEIEDEFVVGYGLDYDGQYRNLPCVAVLKPELYDDGLPRR